MVTDFETRYFWLYGTDRIAVLDLLISMMILKRFVNKKLYT